jgi:hypothetical protein
MTHISFYLEPKYQTSNVIIINPINTAIKYHNRGMS